MPRTSAVPPPDAMSAQLAAWHGLTAEGLRDGLAWEGGGLVDFADTVRRCWSRAVPFLEDAGPTDVPSSTHDEAGGDGPGFYSWAGPEWERIAREAAAELRAERHAGQEWRPWRCSGCGAQRPRWDARGGGRGRSRVHAPTCPTMGTERRPGRDYVWAPALTPALCWWRAWQLRPEDRPRLEQLFAPVRRELARRLASFYEHPPAAQELPPRTRDEAQRAWGQRLADARTRRNREP